MRLLADENFPLPAVRVLRQAGHDVSAVVEDASGSSDATVLARAYREGRILVTRDRDFGQLVFWLRGASPPSIIYVRYPDASDPSDFGDLVLTLLEREGERIVGNLLVVSPSRVRVRALP